MLIASQINQERYNKLCYIISNFNLPGHINGMEGSYYYHMSVILTLSTQ